VGTELVATDSELARFQRARRRFLGREFVVAQPVQCQVIDTQC
jgi:hypothetical protein